MIIDISISGSALAGSLGSTAFFANAAIASVSSDSRAFLASASIALMSSFEMASMMLLIALSWPAETRAFPSSLAARVLASAVLLRPTRSSRCSSSAAPGGCACAGGSPSYVVRE